MSEDKQEKPESGLIRALRWMDTMTIRHLPRLLKIGAAFLAIGIAIVVGAVSNSHELGGLVGAMICATGSLTLGYLLSFEIRRLRREQQWLVRFSQRVRDYAVENIEPLRTSLDALKDVPDDKPPETADPAADSGDDRPLTTRERNTLLVVIATLCAELKIDPNRPAKSASIIKDAAVRNGLSIGESTIEGVLKKLPEAIAARSSRS
jgi:hypothetical protein